MNILDLKKGDKVFVGINRGGSGFPTSAFCAEEVNVRDIMFCASGDNLVINVRVQWDDYIQVLSSNADEFIYNTKEDFFDGVKIKVPTKQELIYFISTIVGFETEKEGFLSFSYWKWNETKKDAEKRRWLVAPRLYSLFNLPVPKDAYPTREACIKANKKTIKMAVHKTFTRFVDVEADSIEEADRWIDEHFENECDPVNNPDIIGDYYTEPVNDD